MAKRLDWEARNRHAKATRGNFQKLTKATGLQIHDAYGEYAKQQRMARKPALSRRDWREQIFAVLMNRST